MGTSDSPTVMLFPGQEQVSPDVLLEVAKNAKLTEVIILGFDSEGKTYVSCSEASMRDVAYLMFKAQIFLQDYCRNPNDGL